MTRTGSNVARVNGEDDVKFEHGRARGQLVAAGHQPRRRPAGPHPQPDCADVAHRRRRQVARGRHGRRPRATRRSPRNVRRAPAQRDVAQVRRGVGARARMATASRSRASAARRSSATRRARRRSTARPRNSRRSGSASTAAHLTAASCCYIRQEATMATREGKEDGALDWDKLLAQAEAKWESVDGTRLRDVAGKVSNLRGPDVARERAEPGAAPSRDAQLRVMQTALARVQEHKTTWTPRGPDARDRRRAARRGARHGAARRHRAGARAD